MKDNIYYLLKGYLSEYMTDVTYEQVETFARIRRLAKKHHRLAEYDCNGEGIVKGKFYRLDGNYKGAYLPDGETSIFTAESDKIEEKIKKLAESIGLTADFQGDPRGATVTLKASDNRTIYPNYV